MEPSWRNRWQPGASGSQPKAAQIGETVAVGCHRLPETFHGKEGVDGSSPSEGFARFAATFAPRRDLESVDALR